MGPGNSLSPRGGGGGGGGGQGQRMGRCPPPPRGGGGGGGGGGRAATASPPPPPPPRPPPGGGRGELVQGSVRERINPSLRTAQNQRVHIVRAFVGVHHFQIHQVAGHTKLVADAVAAHHVARQAGNVQRLAAAVALDDGGAFHAGRARVLHAAEL